MLDYGQSEYVRQCGIVVNPQFVEVDARILPEPVIKCFPDRDPRKAEFVRTRYSLYFESDTESMIRHLEAANGTCWSHHLHDLIYY